MAVEPHIISINETWLKPNQQGEFKLLFDYTFLPNNRSNSKGRGVALYIRKDINFSMRNDITVMHEKLCESLFVDVLINKKKTITVGTIYRSPSNNSECNINFISTLSAFLKSISKSKSQTIIMGDFNYNLLDIENPRTIAFVETMYQHNLYSIINKPIRIIKDSSTLIGHIYGQIFLTALSSVVYW